MIRTASLITIGITLFGFAAAPAFAESRTNVSVTSDTGSNTVCVNGECTTTSGENNGESTVCVNGKCFDSKNGDVNYQSEDGNTKVTINSNSSVNVTQNGEKTIDIANDVKPTIEQEVKAAKEELEGKKKEAEEKINEVTGFDLMKFLQAEFESLKKLFTLEFLFGK